MIVFQLETAFNESMKSVIMNINQCFILHSSNKVGKQKIAKIVPVYICVNVKHQ